MGFREIDEIPLLAGHQKSEAEMGFTLKVVRCLDEPDINVHEDLDTVTSESLSNGLHRLGKYPGGSVQAEWENHELIDVFPQLNGQKSPIHRSDGNIPVEFSRSGVINQTPRCRMRWTWTTISS